jgi:hypothetical protein
VIISNVKSFNPDRYNLTKGEYHFEWIYFYKNIEGYKLGMELKWLVVEGITDGTLECNKCEYGYSEEGSRQCDRCPAFTYFDPHTSKVRLCKFSV